MPALQQETRGATSNFAVAVLLHGLLLSGLGLSAFVSHHKGEAWGDHTDLAGAVQATMVNSLPLPPKVQPRQDQVLASESPSPAPPPPTPKAEPPPRPTDIPVVVKKPDRTPAKVADKPAPDPPKKPQPHTPEPQEATSGDSGGVRMAMTAVENKAGTSSTNVTDSAFGQRYAFYVRQLTQKVAQQWFTQTLDSGAVGHRVYISFRVARDGTPSDVTVAKASGDASLDGSAVRALQRIDTFGPLPDGYTGQYINVQYYFDPKPQ